MRYTVIQFENGFYGVEDTQTKGFRIVASGMTEMAANTWADRLNLRHVWGT